MYIRNVKQLLRAHRGNGVALVPGIAGNSDAGGAGGFDERQYGFGGLMDLLRACQRDGVLRLERDRRGGLRVFPGAALQRPGGVHVEPSPEPSQPESSFDGFGADDDGGPPLIPVDTEPADLQGIPVDSTAELLGRAKPRRPRSKAPAGGGARRTGRATGSTESTAGAGAAGPRRPRTRRAARSKKTAAEPSDDNS